MLRSTLCKIIVKNRKKKKNYQEDVLLNHSHQYLSRGAWSHTQHRPKTYPFQTLSWLSVVPFSTAILQVQDQFIQAVTSCVDSQSHHIDAVSSAHRRSLAAVGEATVVGGGAVHV